MDIFQVFGEPLIYYGKFLYNTQVPLDGTVTGFVSGWAEGYATSYEDFLEVLQNGEAKMTADWNAVANAEIHDIDWSIDDDYAIQNVGDEVGEYYEDDLSDFIGNVSIG